ncbi:MAG: hypothetical protein UY48_C0005G0050 [Candidatus Gottesmanbacteria bacterium GW2011_GWB1_49_7]|uniref:PD-(D/E)XK endonuclease-like domain-containing protein n=1 Tax=Candidatus Gottesmanbacteria bacterium GW2011_GWB1_49_7 TaxID=1618448 RepID=A0A0G1Z2U3_9BACT|nr:MAG: hypothetical protein UY48_C0005G0050 [Candidatus Gottesmanbacteria bacterium GW2011_GWB1_49_7]
MLIEIIKKAAPELLGNPDQKHNLMLEVARLVSDKKDMRRPKRRIGPSTLDGCPRRMYYEWQGYTWDKEPQQDPSALLMLQIRLLVHSYYQVLVQRALQQHGYLAVTEQAFNKEPFAGHIDLVFWKDDPAHKVIIEIKTTKGARFEKIKSPTAAMKKQLATYMWASNTPQGIVLLVDMETGDKKEWEATPWYDWARGEVEQKVSGLMLAEAMNIPMAPRRSRYNCSVCPFTERCQGVK